MGCIGYGIERRLPGRLAGSPKVEVSHLVVGLADLVAELADLFEKLVDLVVGFADLVAHLVDPTELVDLVNELAGLGAELLQVDW